MKNFLLISIFIATFVKNSPAQFTQQWMVNTNPLNEHLFNTKTYFSQQNELVLAVSGNMSDSLYLANIDSLGNFIWQGNYSFNTGANDKINSRFWQDDSLNYYFSIMNSAGSKLIKLDPSGNVLQVHNDTLFNSLYNLPNYTILMEKSNSGLYAVKRFIGSKMLLLIKYDLQFNVLWSRILVTAESHFVYAVQENANGKVHVLFARHVTGSPPGVYLNKQSVFNLNGDTLLQVQLDTLSNAGPGPVAIDGYGNVILSKYFQVGLQTGNDDCTVSRYDTSGNLSWSVTLPDSGAIWRDLVTSVYGDNTGCTYILSSQNFNQLATSSGNIILSKYDPAGGLIWTHTFTGNDPTGISSGQQCITIGLTLEVIGDTSVWVLGNVCDMFENANAFAVQLDSSGTILWQHNYNALSGLNDNYRFVHQDNCGNIYLIGVTDSMSWSYKAYAHVTKFTYDDGCLNTGINTPPDDDEFKLKIFPNPASSGFNVSTIDDNGIISIYDIQGKLVLSTIISSKITYMSTKHLPVGVYPVRVTSNNEISMGRVVILKE